MSIFRWQCEIEDTPIQEQNERICKEKGISRKACRDITRGMRDDLSPIEIHIAKKRIERQKKIEKIKAQRRLEKENGSKSLKGAYLNLMGNFKIVI